MERKDWKNAGHVGDVKLLPSVVSKGRGRVTSADEEAAVAIAAVDDAVADGLAFCCSPRVVAMTDETDRTCSRFSRRARGAGAGLESNSRTGWSTAKALGKGMTDAVVIGNMAKITEQTRRIICRKS